MLSKQVYIQIFVCMLPKLQYNGCFFGVVTLSENVYWKTPLFPKENPGFKNYFINLNFLFIQLRNVRVILVR